MSYNLPGDIEISTPNWLEQLGLGLGQGVQTGAATQLEQMLKQQQLQAQASQPMTPYQALQTKLREKELEQKEAKEKERAAEWGYTQHKGFREEVTANYKDAMETEMRLNRMQNLNDSGKLTGPARATFLEKLGLPLGVLGNPESEEFDKLSKDLLKNIRTYFGARIYTVEVENFLKTIPTLMNSKEGRDRIIKNLKLLIKPRKMMFEEYRRIRKEAQKTGKPLPLDLQETVLENLAPKLDELAKNFEWGEEAESAQASAQDSQGQELETFEKMPSAKDYPGAVIEDDKGNRYKSTGKNWRKI